MKRHESFFVHPSNYYGGRDLSLCGRFIKKSDLVTRPRRVTCGNCKIIRRARGGK